MLSKYQEKQKRKYEETESGKVAYAIAREFEHEIVRLRDEELKIGNDISVFNEGYALIVCKPVPEKGNRFWIKVLPRYESDIDRIIDILDAQAWHYW